MLNNYFQDRSQVTRIDNYTTEPLIVEDGAPQGSGLSSTWFDIYINDLPLLTKLFSILFADDTTLSDSSSSVDKLISAFKLKFEPVLEWCKSNRIFTPCIIRICMRTLVRTSISMSKIMHTTVCARC